MDCKDNLEIIKKMFSIINITIENLEDLELVELDRDLLLKEPINNEFSKLIDSSKKVYNSSKLTSLHKNRLEKQKFPAINLLRQILKCNNYKLGPKTTSLGYHKNGKKIIKRSYIINKIV
jgi:hypothetical protein